MRKFMIRNLHPGELLKRRLDDTNFHYYLFVPDSLTASTPVFISVHGWSRNVLEHAHGYLPLAQKYKVILIAPYFGRRHFPQFQQLGNSIANGRADRVLDMITAEVIRLTGIKKQPLYLFGYSGGGQFVHRYVMAHPQNVVRAALGAPGWYTFPDPAQGFPLGIGPNSNLSDIHFKPAAFLRIPVSIFIGELDFNRNHHFNTSREIDKFQGTNRQERARNWVRAMTAAARARNYETEYSLELLANSEHSFTDCMLHGHMGEKVFNFLFGRLQPAVSRTNIIAANSK